MSELASVWPLVEGLKGINNLTSKSCKLYPFQKGYMDLEEAKELQADGKLQLMAGLDLQSLIQEGDNAPIKPAIKPKPNRRPPVKKQTTAKKQDSKNSKYDTKVMTPDTGSNDKFLD